MTKSMKRILAFFFVLLFIPDGKAQTIDDKEAIKAVMDKVNKYQHENPFRPEADDINNPIGNWTRAVYYIGVMAGYQATGDINYLKQCDDYGNLLNWRVASLAPDHRFSGCNLLTPAQIWLESYMVNREERKIRPLIAHLEDPAIKNPVSNPLQWCFELGNNLVDVLFTGPPALAMLYSVTKEEKYLQWMEVFFWEIYGELYDHEENLFYRDKRFFPDCREQKSNDPAWKGNHQVTAAGKKVLWSRGNGWAFAALVRILKYLPGDHPNYPKYEQLYRNLAQSIKSRQSEEGFWYPNLDDPNDFPVKESSGTGFFIYGFAYGINNGILDRDEYLPAVEKGWKFLCNAVSEEGKVQWGQRVGDRPVMVKMEDSHEYVNGIFLLAGSEVYKLSKI